MDPLRSPTSPQGQILKDKHIQTVFLNLDKILCENSGFLKRLHKRILINWATNPCLGDIFLRLVWRHQDKTLQYKWKDSLSIYTQVPCIQPYREYVQNQNKAIMMVKKLSQKYDKFASFCNVCLLCEGGRRGECVLCVARGNSWRINNNVRVRVCVFFLQTQKSASPRNWDISSYLIQPVQVCICMHLESKCSHHKQT